MARYWAQAILLGVTVAITTAAPAGAQTYKLADHHAYSREIAEAAARHAVPERLVWAVIRAESGFDARAVSRQGARGLMQLMPETAAAVDLVRRIHAELGLALCVVEHVMEVVMPLSQRVVVLDYGEKIAEGPPAEIARNEQVIKAYLGEHYRGR